MTYLQAYLTVSLTTVCVAQLPGVFLQNPSTFDVAECGVFDVAFGSPAGAEEEMAQLKRCHKLVEGQLLSQISSKFSSFFVLLQDLEVSEWAVWMSCSIES